MKPISQSKKQAKLSPQEIEQATVQWYYLDEKHNVVPWKEKFPTWPDYIVWWGTTERQLFRDQVGPARVSTIFLGLDHSYDTDPLHKPIVFETLVFGGINDCDMQRYCTYEEAKVGHEQAVKAQPSGLTREELEAGADLIRKLMGE